MLTAMALALKARHSSSCLTRSAFRSSSADRRCRRQPRVQRRTIAARLRAEKRGLPIALALAVVLSGPARALDEMSADWQQLRRQQKRSHAANAILASLALGSTWLHRDGIRFPLGCFASPTAPVPLFRSGRRGGAVRPFGQLVGKRSDLTEEVATVIGGRSLSCAARACQGCAARCGGAS